MSINPSACAPSNLKVPPRVFSSSSSSSTVDLVAREAVAKLWRFIPNIRQGIRTNQPSFINNHPLVPLCLAIIVLDIV